MLKTLLGDLKSAPSGQAASKHKKNELINKPVDMKFESSNFFEQFYLIFNDQFRTKVESKDLSGVYLTENDVDQFYSITNVSFSCKFLISGFTD